MATPIGKVAMIGSIYERRLAKLDIYTIEDLLFHFPFRYEDFSTISKVSQLQAGETVTVQGKVKTIKNEFTRNRKFIQKAAIDDETGSIDVVWFNQTYLTKTLPPQTAVSLSGKVDIFRKQLAFVSPAWEILQQSETIHTARLVPIYPETYGLSSKWLRAKIKQLLSLYENDIREYLPALIVEKHGFLPFSQAIAQIHFPQNFNQAQKARERLAFDEMLLIHLKSLLRKKDWGEKRISQPFAIAKFKREIQRFWQSLPFRLTGGQNRAVKEIFADLAKDRPMNRLLEGDVGSGKTVVAAIGMYLAFLNGRQSVLMAPTEILANQHFDTISRLLTPFGVTVALQTGSRKTAKNSTDFDIIVGTHALLSKSLAIDKLGLIVIDEQHRFGVEQRALLLKKSSSKTTPHTLTMTATPIPRTVALTMYGDLDLSYLDEMPLGRLLIKTWVVPPVKREGAYKWIGEQIVKTQAQVFIICPFIEESESQTTVRAATKEYERLKQDIFRDYRLGLLHGKMKAKEKEKVMEDFKKQSLDIMVATPVVEVGIDIPGATIIVIEGSERFGLAQLHQLRGRVGRNDKQSYCLLFSETESGQSLNRLKSMERISVGAELAQLDLTLRGPGELTGTKQHGIPMLKIASFSDAGLIEKTRIEAKALLKNDPELEKTGLLKEKLKTYTIQVVEPN